MNRGIVPDLPAFVYGALDRVWTGRRRRGIPAVDGLPQQRVHLALRDLVQALWQPRGRVGPGAARGVALEQIDLRRDRVVGRVVARVGLERVVHRRGEAVA